MGPLEVNCLVNNAFRSNEEEKLEHKDIEKYLEAAGLPQRVAEEVAERVENSVKGQWTRTRVNEQIDVELRRLEEDLQKAASTYREKTAVEGNRG
jgi:hypothetical protein